MKAYSKEYLIFCFAVGSFPSFFIGRHDSRFCATAKLASLPFQESDRIHLTCFIYVHLGCVKFGYRFVEIAMIDLTRKIHYASEATLETL